MIFLKTPEEMQKMQAACTLVSDTLGEVAKWVAPGVTTRKLDNVAREFMLDNGGRPPVSAMEAFLPPCASRSTK